MPGLAATSQGGGLAATPLWVRHTLLQGGGAANAQLKGDTMHGYPGSSRRLSLLLLLALALGLASPARAQTPTPLAGLEPPQLIPIPNWDLVQVLLSHQASTDVFSFDPATQTMLNLTTTIGNEVVHCISASGDEATCDGVLRGKALIGGTLLLAADGTPVTKGIIASDHRGFGQGEHGGTP